MRAKQQPETGPSEFAELVIESLTRRLTGNFPRARGQRAPTVARRPLHRNFRFIRAEPADGRFADQLRISYSWTTTPARVDTAAVDLARLRRQTEADGPELCAGFIVQELEEDLCGGETPHRPALVGMGITYQLGE